MKAWRPAFGEGLYTTADVIMLGLRPQTISPWLNRYWQSSVGEKQFIKENNSKVFNFYVFIELYTISRLREMGISFQKIASARKTLSEEYQSAYPFAKGNLLCDGSSILYEVNDKTLLNLTKHNRYELKDLVESFCKKVDFEKKDRLACRYWPMGKESEVVVNPHIALGQPSIHNTGITAEAIYRLHKAGDKPAIIIDSYGISKKQYADAVQFMQTYRLAA